MMDEVVVQTTWRCTQGIMHFKHIVKKKKQDQIACKIEGKLVLVNEERLICDIPDQMRELLQGTGTCL